MKKTCLLMTVLCMAFMAGAQTKEGTIFYESETDIRSRVPESMRAMLPAVIKMKMQLVFKDSIAVFTDTPDDDANNNGTGIMINNTPSIIYSDLASGIATEQTEVAGTTYRIIDTLYRMHWQLVPDSAKTIAGFVCKKATATGKEGKTIQAWYTEKIPLHIGPRQYGNLPGMILASDDGEIKLTATRFVASVDKELLQKPKKGRVISRKDYTEKLQSTLGGGNGNTRIMTFGN